MRIAGRWFEIEGIGDGITWITEPHAERMVRCNIWHVRGRERDLLVDSGLGIASLAEGARQVFGHAVAAVATHAHYDHIGGFHEFAERLMHPLEVEIMAGSATFATLDTDAFPPDIVAVLREAGYACPGLLIDALPHAGYALADYRIQGTDANRHIDEGDVIDIGDRHFEVLHLPGHSPGSIGLWEAASGVLFSGDAVYDGPLIDGLPESSVAQYVTTMKRLRELPVRVVHGGHEPSFGRDRLVEIADAYLRRHDG